jgi:hypothetical protein
MSSELATVQHELRIARQDAEIMKLKFELQKVQAEKASRLEDSLFAPALFPHYQKVAETLAKSSVIPTSYRNKPEDVFVAMAMGYQLGFPVEQSLQDIAVINGRPCLWGDGLLSLVLNHPECQDIKEEPIYNGKTVVGYACTVIRRGHEPHTKSFSMPDAERAGLLKKGGVWNAYPERMLQMRARSLALRDKFADALRGLRIAEVEQDDTTVIDAEVIDISKNIKQVQKLKDILQSNNSQGKELNAGVGYELSGAEISDKNQENITVHNTGKDDEPISPDQLDEIECLLEIKGFDANRRKKALDYFKVNALEDLTQAQAVVFLLQLGRA